MEGTFILSIANDGDFTCDNCGVKRKTKMLLNMHKSSIHGEDFEKLQGIKLNIGYPSHLDNYKKSKILGILQGRVDDEKDYSAMCKCGHTFRKHKAGGGNCLICHCTKWVFKDGSVDKMVEERNKYLKMRSIR